MIIALIHFNRCLLNRCINLNCPNVTPLPLIYHYFSTLDRDPAPLTTVWSKVHSAVQFNRDSCSYFNRYLYLTVINTTFYLAENKNKPTHLTNGATEKHSPYHEFNLDDDTPMCIKESRKQKWPCSSDGRVSIISPLSIALTKSWVSVSSHMWKGVCVCVASVLHCPVKQYEQQVKIMQLADFTCFLGSTC